MPATAIVTAQITDLGYALQPGWQPLVRIALDRPAVTLDGVAVTTEPVEMVDNGSGRLSAELIVSAEFSRPVRYIPTVDWLSPSGGTSLRDTLPAIVVPVGGGTLGDLGLVETGWGLAWQGGTPPSVSMLWLYIDPTYDPDSGDPLPVYTAPDGTTIEHGELVEWSA